MKMTEEKTAKKILAYKTAGKLLNKHLKNKPVPEDLLPEDEKLKIQITKLVETALDHLIHIEDIIEKTNIFVEDPELEKPLVKIFITELLWGKKKLKHECPQLEKFKNFTEAIKNAAAKMGAVPKTEGDVEEEETNEETGNQTVKSKRKQKNVIIVRYLQVVLRKQTVEDAINELCSNYWEKVERESDDYESFITKATNLKDNEFMVDVNIENLLVFKDSADFKKIDMNKGFLIVRKSNILPITLLNPPEGSHVLDMIAGSGVNAVRLGDAINNKGKVFSIQENPELLKISKDTTILASLSNVILKSGEAYKFYDTDFKDVQHILIDPNEIPLKEPEREFRLNYSRLLLKHALSSFRKAERVVYKTLSKSMECNEDIVHRVISQTPYYKLVNAWELLKGPFKLPGSADLKNKHVSSHCVMFRSEKDLTNNAFIAVFEKLKEGEVNDLFGTYVFEAKKAKKRSANGEVKEVIETPAFDEGEDEIKEEADEDVETTNDGSDHEVADEEMETSNVKDEEESEVIEETVTKKVKKEKKKGNKKKNI